MARLDDLPRVEVRSREELRHWLAANHEQSGSVWLITWKKVPDAPHVSYDTVVEEALCFGWIDSLPRRLDADRTMVLLSPRRPGSPWSALNKRRVERLIAAGRMADAGLERVAAARADGSWTVLDAAERLEIPHDLADALAGQEGAMARWEALPPSRRKGLLHQIALAKTDATRARRIQAAVQATIG